MKVKHLLKEIEEQRKEYGEDFLEWDIYVEQMGFWKGRGKPIDNFKKEISNWKDYKPVEDGDNWLYLRAEDSGDMAWCGKWPKEKILTIQVNF
jgi:hypothetical protein